MNLQAILDRAITLHRADDLAGAEPLYRQLLQVRPHPNVFYMLGRLCQQSGRDKDAQKYFDDCLALQPDHAHALCGRGDMLKKAGRVREALGDYDMASALRPDEPEIHYNRGIILFELKRHAEAVQSYDRAAALN